MSLQNTNGNSTRNNSSPRHIARTIAIQALYELDINEELKPGSAQAEKESEKIIARDRDEFAPQLTDLTFANEIVKSCIGRLATLDEIIQKAAPEWPIQKINIVDRNVLRLGLTELLFGDRTNVPPKVAIDEAIEIAKEFGGETSGRFVNGVLGAVYKELGEPDKGQTSKKNSKSSSQSLVGAVIYSETAEGKYLAFVHDVFGRWTLVKGSLQDGDDPETGARREIKNEIGLDVTIEKKIGFNEYVAHNPEKGKIKKQVSYFLAKGKHMPLELEEGKTGLDKVEWFPLAEVGNLHLYDDLKPMIMQAVAELMTK